MGDLARFFGAVFRGGVYHDPATLKTMLSTFEDLAAAPGADEKALPPGAYRMGMWVVETEGYTTYHHTGFWGTTAIHVPDLDLTIAATANQNQCGDEFDRIVAEVIRIVAEGS
jgi:D-alanyl-D-alanine carboxypeptidase